MLQLFCFIGINSAANKSPHRFIISMPRIREEFSHSSSFASFEKNDDNQIDK